MQKIERAKGVGDIYTHISNFYRTNSTANENYNLKEVKRIKIINKYKTKTYEKQIGY